MDGIQAFNGRLYSEVRVYRAFFTVLIIVFSWALLADGADAAGNGAGRTAFDGKITSIKAVHVSRAAPPKKLNDVIARHTAEVDTRGVDRPSIPKPHEVVAEWQVLIARLRGMPKRDRVLEVERYFAAFRYVSDRKGWQKKDYWASPYEFLARRQGDCEDYAVTRYLALRAAGFEDKDLNLVGVTDRRSRQFHMVLAVNVDGEIMVLDNQARRAVATIDLRRYEPAYAINQNNRWITRRAG